MAHKTLISGTAYSVTGGRELIGGTGYGCKAGKTLIGGTAFTVPLGSAKYTITLTGSGGKITYNGVEQTETFTVAAGESITITATAFTTSVGVPQSAIIQLNGTTVSSKRTQRANQTVTATYTYTPEQDTKIIRSKRNIAANYSTTINIETT